ncbi:MAG TPA: OsmC family protein [Candidatus Hodarchaeales archaeon]|nr:OsmC family protein [Candidatus Hodarchaeales archaeon]
MSKQTEHSFSIEVRKTGPMEFAAKFDKDFPILMFDEPPNSGGRDKFPNASRVLTAAIVNCLSASLTFCLTKTRIDLEGFSLIANAICTISRNEAGRLRIKNISVELHPKVSGNQENLIKALERCREQFMEFCTVSASVKRGIDISVTLV